MEKLLSDTTRKLNAFLDNEIGAGSGNKPDDYDSPEAILNYAIEAVSEQNNLTAGCGVGPLMDDISQWVNEFVAGFRNTVSEAPFCLQVKFDPIALGFVLYKSQTELESKFPQPFKQPASYPVFARHEYTVGRVDQVQVLAYLEYAAMTIEP